MSHPTNGPLRPQMRQRLTRAIQLAGTAEAACRELEMSERPLLRAAVGLPVRRTTRTAIEVALDRFEARHAEVPPVPRSGV